MKEKQDRRGAPNSRTASEAPEGPAALLLLPLGHVWTGEMGSRHMPEKSGRETRGDSECTPQQRKAWREGAVKSK